MTEREPMTLEDVRDWHYTQASYYTAHDREAAARHTAFADAIDAAIKQREQGANSPLKGWIFDKVSIGRGDERYICTPDGANATTVRNESTSDHRERLLWLIADAMAKESAS